ncbi:MAG: hypothetical protein ACE5KE_04615 [Methanosarcinales archaeon]
MKWLKKIFGMKEKEEVSDTIEFNSIDTWLEKESKKQFHELSENADKVYKDLKETLEQLKQDISELKNSEPKDDVPTRLVKAGLTNRDNMIRHLNSIVSKTKVPIQSDYESILEFYKTTTSYLQSNLEKFFQSRGYVKALFPEETDQVVSDVKTLESLLRKLIEPTKGLEEKIKAFQKAPEQIRYIQDLYTKIDQEKSKKETLEIRLSDLKKTINMQNEKIKSLKNSDLWKKFKDLESSRTTYEKELKKLESEVNKIFSPISKALIRLEKQDDSGRYTLKPEHRKILNLCLSNPIQVLNYDTIDFLLELQKIVEKNTLNIKEGKRDKILEQINYILENKILESSKKQYDKLQSKIEKINQDISNITIQHEIKNLEKSIYSANDQIAQLHHDIELSQKYIDLHEKELKNKKKILQETLETIAGKKVKVIY